MGIIKCPQCGKNTSDLKPYCDFCAENLGDNSKNTKASKVYVDSKISASIWKNISEENQQKKPDLSKKGDDTVENDAIVFSCPNNSNLKLKDCPVADTGEMCPYFQGEKYQKCAKRAFLSYQESKPKSLHYTPNNPVSEKKADFYKQSSPKIIYTKCQYCSQNSFDVDLGRCIKCGMTPKKSVSSENPNSDGTVNNLGFCPHCYNYSIEKDKGICINCQYDVTTGQAPFLKSPKHHRRKSHKSTNVHLPPEPEYGKPFVVVLDCRGGTYDLAKMDYDIAYPIFVRQNRYKHDIQMVERLNHIGEIVGLVAGIISFIVISVIWNYFYGYFVGMGGGLLISLILLAIFKIIATDNYPFSDVMGYEKWMYGLILKDLEYRGWRIDYKNSGTGTISYHDDYNMRHSISVYKGYNSKWQSRYR